MTPSQLKRLYETNNPEGKFFCRENMKFAGDTMRNFVVRREEVKRAPRPEPRPNLMAWCLYRKHPVKHGIVGFVKAFGEHGDILCGYEPA